MVFGVLGKVVFHTQAGAGMSAVVGLILGAALFMFFAVASSQSADGKKSGYVFSD